MKFVVTLLLIGMIAAVASPERHIISSAILKVGDETISTPKAQLYLGVEAVRRVSVMLKDKKYIFALKSSAYEKGGTYKYSVGLSLSDSGKDEYIVSNSGEMKVLEPVNFNFEKDGIRCTAMVNLASK